MNKKIKNVVSLLLLIVGLFTFAVKNVSADEEVTTTASGMAEVNVYMFRGEGCGYCAKALEWFNEIEESEGSYFNLITYEVWNDESNKNLMNRVAAYLGDDVSGVPYIIVGNKSYQGFNDSYKQDILDLIHTEYAKNVEDRTDVLKDINENKDVKKADVGSYIIVAVVVGLIALVVIARKSSSEEEALNYEEIITEETEKEVIKEKKTSSKSVKKAGEVNSTKKKNNSSSSKSKASSKKTDK